MIMESREHWLCRLKALRRCYAPYLTPATDVYKLSCSELRDLVIRSVRQYREFFVVGGWTDKSVSSRKMPYRTLECRDFGWIDPPFSLALLPGGTLLFASYVHMSPSGMLKNLELWQLGQNPRCLWSYHTAVGLEDVDKYTYYLSDDSSSILLFISSSMYAPKLLLLLHTDSLIDCTLKVA